MKFFDKIIHFLSTIVYILVIVYILSLLPNLFGYKYYIMSSSDMEPVYYKNTIIYYKKVDKENIYIGDYISYQDEEETKVARVTFIKDNQFYVKTNNKNDVGKTIDYSQILGKNFQIITKYLGVYTAFVKSNLVLCSLIALVIIILDIILNKRKKKKVLVIDE